MARVKKIEILLSERPEKTIILITHGWFLRLLELYFVQGKHTDTDITLQDILDVSLFHSVIALRQQLRASIALNRVWI